jgi:oligosaccharide repeat unit polymerase
MKLQRSSLVYVLVIQAIVTLAVSVLPALREFTPVDMVYPQCVALLGLFLWSLFSSYVSLRSLFEPYVLFLISAFLFNAGQPMLEAIGLTPSIGMLNGMFSSPRMTQTLYLVMVCLAWMHLGGLLAALAWPPLDRPGGEMPVVTAPTTARNLRQLGWLFLAVAFVPTVYITTKAFAIVVARGSMGFYQQQAAVGVSALPDLVSQLIVPGGLFLLAGAERRTLHVRVASAALITYSLAWFFLGARSSGAMVLCAYVWLWSRTVRPIRGRLLAIGGAIVMVVVFPLVRVFRGLTGEDRWNPALVAERYSQIDNPAVAIVTEFGYSMVTVAHTVELVPAERAHGLGEGYAYGALSVVPNFFWDIHPTIARGLACKWLVERVEPLTAATGGGIGYSCIAEAYLEFGWYGAPLVMAVIGFGAAAAALWARRSGDPARLAAMATFLAFFLRFPRDESASVVRPLVWYVAIPYLIVATREAMRARGGGHQLGPTREGLPMNVDAPPLTGS